MHKLKSHQTVENIAKKHRMDVSFVRNQLRMGIAIEKEHTKDKDLATDIALQHLDEFPDYYTKLKKMESDAKKEHKKFKDVKEATDGIKAKDYKGRLDKWFDDGGWVQTGGKYDGKPCAKQPGQTTKPYCRDPDDRADMSKEERNKRASKKRREDPNPNRTGEAKMVTQESAGEKDACYKKVKSRYDVWPSAYASGALVKCRKVGAANWGNKSESVNLSSKDPLSEQMGMVRYCPKCEKDETREECRYGPKYWDMFSVPSSLSPNQLKYNTTRPHPANESKETDHEYSMARSEISTIISAAKRLRNKLKGEGNIEAWVQSKITKAADYIDAAADYLESGEHDVVDEACWVGYKQVGMKKKGKKMVPNCVKESVSIEDSNGNHYAQFIDIIKPEPLKATKGIGSRLVGESISSEPKLKPGSGLGGGKPVYEKGKEPKPTGAELPKLPLAQKKTKLQVAHYEPKTKSFTEFMIEANKSEMKCNSPKSEPVGDSLTGKSHVVKACEGGKEKLIRFGQRGVKGSPKKKGESKEYASRRNRFQTRHAKNIAKGKMSAAYWANKVKW